MVNALMAIGFIVMGAVALSFVVLVVWLCWATKQIFKDMEEEERY